MRSGEGAFEHTATSTLFDPEQRRLLIGREAGTVESWSIDGPAGFSTWTVQSRRVEHLAQAGRPGLVFVGSEPTQMRDLRTGRVLDTVAVGFGPTHRTPDPDVQAIANSSTLHFYDTRRRITLPASVRCLGVITSLAVDLGSRRLAVGSASGSVEVWQFEHRDGDVSLREVAAWEPYKIGNWVVGLAFADDGRALYAVARKGEIDLWDISRRERLKTVRTQLKLVQSSSFAQGRNVLAVAGTLDAGGLNESRVELLSLAKPVSRLYYSDYNLARVQYIPPLEAFLALQYDSVKLLDLEPSRAD